MRFLKKKIALKSKETNSNGSDIENTIKPNVEVPSTNEEPMITGSKDNSPETIIMKEDILPYRGPRKTKTPADADSKNIVKNYGKALCAFAASKVAKPYIDNIIFKKGYKQVELDEFMQHMKEKKETTNSMESLRRLLIEEDGDTEKDKEVKTIFKEISIIFMKYFSVNWIFSGRLVHKTAHLKFRFKMLRRIKDPEHFTYLKTTAKTL